MSDASLSSADTVNVTLRNVNAPPIAHAGVNWSGVRNTVLRLDGTGSWDPDPDAVLSFSWAQIFGPPVTLVNADTARPSFIVPDAPTGTEVRFALTVSDGSLFSTAEVRIGIIDSTQPPVANAGWNQSVNPGQMVILDGSDSSDPEHTVLSYKWEQLAGPPVTLPRSAFQYQHTYFDAPYDAADGTVLTFRLTVNDGYASSTDTVDIVLRDILPPPVANAGPDQAVDERTEVTLDGSGSYDPDGERLLYGWQQLAGPPVEINDSYSSPMATFTAPDVTADTVLTFQILVTDGSPLQTDTVNITVRSVNRAPVARAGAAQTVNEHGPVTLDGRGSSDPDQDSLTYAWTQKEGPAVTLAGATSAQPVFTAPEVSAATVLTFQLVVSDGSASSKPKNVSLTVRNVNRMPVAHAGEDQTVKGGVAVTLGGSGEDPDGDALSYRWVQTAGPTMTLSSATDVAPTFTAPGLIWDEVLTFTLKVTDAHGASAEDSVTITVKALPDVPGHGDETGSGCGCSSDSTAAGALMPLVLLGLLLRSRRRWPVH